MNIEIKIRPVQLEDGKQIGQLIYDTVRSINRKDYDQQQVEAWAPDSFIFSTYEESFAYVAEHNGLILGFGNLTTRGYLHRFYVHKDFQGQGIGSLLLETLEFKAQALGLKEITTEASITAKPFFLAKGWIVKKQQSKFLRGESFINYKMSKKLS
jgi:GNAT superfamily N-acetyltransferase